MAHTTSRRPDGWVLPRSDGPYPLPPSSPEHQAAVELLIEVEAAGGLDALPERAVGAQAGQRGGATLRARFVTSVRRVAGYVEQPRPNRYSDPTRYEAEMIQFYDRYTRALASVVLTHALRVHHLRRVEAGLVPGQSLPPGFVIPAVTAERISLDRVLAEDPYDPYDGVLTDEDGYALEPIPA